MSNRAKRVSGQPRMDELLAFLQGEWGDGGYNGPPTPQGPTSLGSGGSTYVRWGRTVCPTIPGTSLVYSGYAAGGHYYQSGSGANYICLSQTPEYLDFSTADTAQGLVMAPNMNLTVISLMLEWMTKTCPVLSVTSPSDQCS